jgi:hypothetical protein
MMEPATTTRPTATATIEPIGPRTSVPRDHAINVTVKVRAPDSKHADRDLVAGLARKSLAGFPPSPGGLDRRRFGDVTVASRAGKNGIPSSVVVAVEGSVIWPGRPANDSVETMRAALADAGYQVAVREKRECAEPTCTTDVMVDWGRPSAVPTSWYSNEICGRHNYRACSRCKSVYTLTSENSPVQAPSVHCAVCGLVMIEWGGSKTWSAELVTRGDPCV